MDVERNGRPRAVVTGIGAITPLGNTAATFWAQLKAGKSGIRQITAFDTRNIGVKIAGEVDFTPTTHLDSKDARRMSRDSQFALVAAREAAADAGLTPGQVDPERIGVAMGTTLGGYELNLRQITKFPETRLGPFVLLNSLPNLPGYYIAREFCAQGPSLTITTACASGAQAIGEAAHMIWRGEAEVVFAGGVEALIEEGLLAGLEAMGVMALGHADDPTTACRPFELHRSGLVYAEGAAILVIESLAHAEARGAHIYGEVLGYGLSTDYANPAIPDPTAKPAVLAMQRALTNARVSLDTVDYINPHGPGTKGDVVESRAIKQVFGDRAYHIPISSTKSMVGHCMGAAGAIEAAATVLSVADGVVHPTINYETPDPECDLDYVPNTARETTVRVALCNNFGLGGQNASLVLGAV
jgi:beta-ketoacyl-acyl-carrier-protein synthase II